VLVDHDDLLLSNLLDACSVGAPLRYLAEASVDHAEGSSTLAAR
jgi:hypothetical protein